ncbi:hypothetical protein BRADI_2g17864v3 [Brachypodium distachyon]|uniref:Uncharacterized protein n=1 Tax=Brachypodium distachyon TaxID=15368 RepID=A0A2K2D920_BRADI|nr:hypothetical protein BRADI_2g17864v3 [Brachypodium distachyon]
MTATRLTIIQHSHPQEIAEPSLQDMYPSQSTSGSRQHAAQLTQDLQAEFAAYGHSLSTGPLLLPREPHQSWLRRMEEKLRSVYAAITCTRTSDVVHHQASVRPPRHSTHQQRPRQQEAPHPRHHPRPRLPEQSTPRRPPPEQAGGSSWHQPQSSFDYWHQQQPSFEVGGSSWQHQQSLRMNFEFRPQTQPQGMYISIYCVRYHDCYAIVMLSTFTHAGAYGHQSSLSEPSWGSEQDHAQGEDYSVQHS